MAARIAIFDFKIAIFAAYLWVKLQPNVAVKKSLHFFRCSLICFPGAILFFNYRTVRYIFVSILAIFLGPLPKNHFFRDHLNVLREISAEFFRSAEVWVKRGGCKRPKSPEEKSDGQIIKKSTSPLEFRLKMPKKKHFSFARFGYLVAVSPLWARK
jgi:hypothetical protein